MGPGRPIRQPGESDITLVDPREARSRLSIERFTQFGFRQLQTKGLHFTLNGRQVWLQGSQIHSGRRDLALHNQWLADQLLRIFRQANVVFLRTFHGCIAPFWYEAANRIGMIMEGESPWWRFPPAAGPPRRAGPLGPGVAGELPRALSGNGRTISQPAQLHDLQRRKRELERR